MARNLKADRFYPYFQRNMGSGTSPRIKQTAEALSHHNTPNDSGCVTSAPEHHENLERSHTILRSSPSTSFPTIRRLSAVLSFVVLLVCCTSLIGAASAFDGFEDQRRSADLLWETQREPSLLIVDTRPPPVAPFMHLYRRQNDAKPSSTASSTASAAPPKSSVATDPKATPSDFTVPTPFDTALSNNYTASCAVFFRTFLTNKDFADCHPFSLMLQTSSGLFDASKSLVRITQTLEATCGVDMTKCTGTMNHLARDLIGDNNCAVDYANDNPQVIQAYNGLIAYEPLYRASCLKDGAGSYCYANAVTNRTAITDPYPYYLPLGVPLPGGTRATCNSCLQDVMAIFSAFAANKTQPISKTYNGAAQQIGIACGAGFVNQTATPLKAAASTPAVSMTPAITLLLMLLLGVFL